MTPHQFHPVEPDPIVWIIVFIVVVIGLIWFAFDEAEARRDGRHARRERAREGRARRSEEAHRRMMSGEDVVTEVPDELIGREVRREGYQVLNWWGGEMQPHRRSRGVIVATCGPGMVKVFWRTRGYETVCPLAELHVIPRNHPWVKPTLRSKALADAGGTSPTWDAHRRMMARRGR